MHPFFNIDVDLIKRLDDAQARELIGRLCESDIARAGLAPCVFYGGDQRAADDGVDVEVAGRPAQDLKEKLARSIAVVQVKAEIKSFSAARIKKEMEPKGQLRPVIAALASDQGIYIIASTKENPSFKVRKARLAAMQEVVRRNGLKNQIRVEFYGAKEIASWVESHPPVGIWLRQQVGKPMNGWQGYGPWAYRETDVGREYTLDQTGRVFGPGQNELIPIADAIASIRADLRAGKATRLLGLSGLGKTRLAQALFDDRLKVHEAALSPNSVIYSDIGDHPSPTPEQMLESLGMGIGETILIVDNCGQETHNALVNLHTKSCARIGLLTIEYDLQEGIAPSTRAYKLDGASDKTMNTILVERFPNLSSMDREVVIGASEGNARLAFAIADTAEHSGQLSALEDRELFRRLFHQRAQTGDELVRCARAASLVYSFDGEDMSSGSELCVLAELAEVSPDTFYRHVAEIKRRGLLQARGKMRAILPHAVGNYLAKEGLEEISQAKVVSTLFTNASPRIKSSFANRLSHLSNSVDAVDIVSSWLSTGGPLSDIRTLRDEEMLIFKRVASLLPAHTLAAIESFLNKNDLGNRTQYDLRSLTGIVNSIAYDSELFAPSVRALIRISDRDQNDRNGRSETRDRITSLFQVIYSGTHATAEQRSELLRELLSSKEKREWKLGIDCLDAALQTLSLSTSSYSRFGTRRRDYGKSPGSVEEQIEWFTNLLTIAGHFASKEDERGRIVRATVGKRARDLLHLDDRTIKALTEFAPLFHTEDGWPEAWTAARLLLKRRGLDEAFRERVKAFAHAVAPRGLRQRVVAKLHSQDLFDDEEHEIENYAERGKEAAREATEVGAELGSELDLLQEMLPQIMARGIRGMTISLGEGVATTHPDIPKLLHRIGIWLARASEQSVSLLFVRGIFSTWAKFCPDEANHFLDTAVEDPLWARWFSDLQRVVPFNSKAVKRMLDAIDYNVAPVEEMDWIGWGKPLADLSVIEFTPLLDRLASKGLVGIRVALDNLHMQVYSAKDLSNPQQAQLAAYCMQFLLDYDWSKLDIEQTMVEHEVDLVVAFAAKHSSFEPLSNLLDKFIPMRKKQIRYSRHARGHLITAVMQKFPERTLSHLMSHAAFKNVGEVADLILSENPVDDYGNGMQLMSDAALISWVATDPMRRTTLAVRVCRLDLVSKQNLGLTENPVGTVIRQLYEMAPFKIDVVKALGSRLLHRSFSSRDIPHMDAGIRMLDLLPIASSQIEMEARDGLKEELAQRIRWMSELSSPREVEPEGFE